MAVTTAGTRALGLLGMLLVTAVGCYSPSIVSGGLLCAAGTDACPAGFSCVANVCVRPDAAIDQVSDRSVDVPDQKVDLVKADVPPDGPACLPPIAGCTPQATGACDPVCQTGCPCNPSKKCSVGLDQSLACFDVKGKQPTWGPCQIMDYGLPTQSDTCIPGDICLQPGGPGDMGYFCFPLCRTSADCTSYGSACVPHRAPVMSSTRPTLTSA